MLRRVWREPLTISTVGDPSAAKRTPDGCQSPSESDILIAQRIREVNYDLQHHLCQVLAKQLTSLGAGTLTKLWTKGELFSKCDDLGIRGLPEPPASWPIEARLLLLETVEHAVPRFITKSLPKWRSDGGASIYTYFINYCLYEFKKAYIAFCRRERDLRRHEVLYENTSSIFDASSMYSAEDLAITRYTLDKVVKNIDNDFDRQIISRVAEQIPQTQIARELGVSPNTIARRLKACRRKLNGWTTQDSGR